MNISLRRPYHGAVVVLLVAGLLTLGCAEKKTQPEPKSNTPTQKTNNETKKPTPSPTVKKGPIKKDPAPVVKKTPTPKPVPKPGPVVKKTPTPTPAPKPIPGVGPKMSGAVIAHASIKSFDALLTRVEQVVSQFKKLPVKMLALKGIQKNLGLTSMDFLDTTRPIRFAVWSPKVLPKNPLAILVPITDRKKAEAAIPGPKKPNARGNAFSVKLVGKLSYVNFIKGYLVLTRNPKLFGIGKAFLEGTLANEPQTRLMSINVKVSTLTAMFGPQIDRMSQMVAGSANLPMGLGPLLKKWVGKVVAFIKDVDQFSIHVDWQGDTLKVPLVFHPKAGSKLQSWAAGLKNRNMTLVNNLPASTMMGFSVNMKPETWILGLMSKPLIKNAYKMNDAEAEKFLSLAKKSLALFAGETHFVVHSHGKYAFSMASLSKVKNGAEYRKLTYEMFDFLMSKVLRMAEKEMKGKIPAGKLKSFADVITLVKPLAARVGINVEVGKKGAVDFLRASLDMAKVTKTLGAKVGPQLLNAWTAVLGTKLEMAIGFGSDLVSVTFGPDAVTLAEGLIARKISADDKLKAAVAGFAKNSILAFYLSPILIANTVARLPIPDIAPLKPTLAGLKATGAVSFSLGGDKNVNLVMSLPMQDVMAMVKAGFAAYMKMKK